MGFGVPIGRWFRGEMKDFVRDVLLSETATKRGMLNRRRRALCNDHLSAERDNTAQIWTLLMMELWFRRFIDRQ